MRLALLALVAACGSDVAPPDGPPGASTLAAIKADIFEKKCATASCHGGATPAAGLNLHQDVCANLVNRRSCLFPSKVLVVPNKGDASFLLDKLHGGASLDGTPASACADTNLQMPYGGVELPGDQVAQIESWIAAGAECGGERPQDAGVDAYVPPDGRAGIASITATATTVAAGTMTTVRVALTKPAPAGGQTIDIDVGSAGVLGAPSALHVDGGLMEVQFDVLGKRPARATMVRATSAATSKQTAIAVTGLAVVEVLADPAGGDNGLEWIKIANTTSVAIDLASYTIGNGRTHYTYSLTQLAGVIPAHGCFVIGGPTTSIANGNPVFSQVFNFAPDLLAGSATDGQATGTALFDLPITAVTDASVPIDGVLCGTGNAAGLVGPDGAPAVPSCPDVATGHSVVRTGPATWVDLATPTPNSCTPL